MDPSTDLSLEPRLASVWELLWSELVRLIDEMRVAVGHHLGGLELRARRERPSRRRGAGEVAVGRSLIRLEMPFEASPPRAREQAFAATFGADVPIVRLFVIREDATRAPEHVTVVGIDPRRELWLTSDNGFGPALLRDRLALEWLFSSFLADH